MIQDFLPIVYGLGFVACLGFLLDYLRTADLGRPHARQIVALNGALAVVLLLVFLVGLNVFTPGPVAYTIYMIFFVIVDIALIYQWVLLYRSRK